MEDRYDFKKEWPKIKKELKRVSEEALKIAKRGEEEVVKFSRVGKIHIDSAALKLKQEHLFHLLGKEYMKAKFPGPHSPKMKKLIVEYHKLEKDLGQLQQNLKTPRKRPARKPARPKALPPGEAPAQN
ncbi:MAG TPA: hypothetical protein PLT76_06320 [Candidatus Omnitrophota bacterium]|nr:hypothetical protein [Candidatus Omnitrophota bacterium]HPB68131.1 hypothetical protein [Candidatus Omnitrophota bacterium]HQO58320.1 hypothetical protein [Candidatus Omnitrophota bacterium]HQP11766.1 hypothetical protein [Candidatus Omnitrophota bacterium]